MPEVNPLNETEKNSDLQEVPYTRFLSWVFLQSGTCHVFFLSKSVLYLERNDHNYDIANLNYLETNAIMVMWKNKLTFACINCVWYFPIANCLFTIELGISFDIVYETKINTWQETIIIIIFTVFLTKS